MADPVSLCASIIGIAGAGYQLAATLETIFRADDSLKHAAQDISLTSSVLQELGKLIEADVSGRNRICSANATKTAEEAMRSCKSIFDEFQAALQSSLRKRQHSSSDDKRSLSALGKLKWPVTSRKMDYLRSNLDKLKSTLNLLLGVLSYAKHLSTEEHANAQVTELMRGGIERLMRLDTESAERHHYKKRAYETNNLDASSTVNRPYDSYIIPSSAQQRFATNNTLLVGNPGPAASEMIAGSLAETRAAPYPISKETSSIQRLPSLPPPPPKQRSYNLTWADISRCQSAVLHLLSYISGIMQQFEQGKDLRESDLKICAVYDDVKKVLDEHISIGAIRLANSFHNAPLENSPLPDTVQVANDSVAMVPGAEIEKHQHSKRRVYTDENDMDAFNDIKPGHALRKAVSKSGNQSIPGRELCGVGGWVDERHQHSKGANWGAPVVLPSICSPSIDIKGPGTRKWVAKYGTNNRTRASNIEHEGPEGFVNHAHVDEEKQRESVDYHSCAPEDYYNPSELSQGACAACARRRGSSRPTQNLGTPFSIPDPCLAIPFSEPGRIYGTPRTNSDPVLTRNDPIELSTAELGSSAVDAKVKRRRGRAPLVQQMPQQMSLSTETQLPSIDTQATPNNPGFDAKPLHIPTTMSTSDDKAVDWVTMSPSSDQTALAAGRQAQTLPPFWSIFQDGRMGVHVRENPIFDPVEDDPVDELIKKWTLLDAEKIHRPAKSRYTGQECPE